MYCDQCGHENRNDRKFCENCGAKLKDYTKPKENLILPEEVQAKQNIIEKKNKISKGFNIAMIISIIALAGFVIGSFFVNDNIKIVFIAISICLALAFIIMLIVKDAIVQNMTYKIKDENEK